ncbi:unnamed protein product [Cunninghamella echinulata]
MAFYQMDIDPLYLREQYKQNQQVQQKINHHHQQQQQYYQYDIMTNNNWYNSFITRLSTRFQSSDHLNTITDDNVYRFLNYQHV